MRVAMRVRARDLGGMVVCHVGGDGVEGGMLV
jgi:hypothetical protein